LSNNQIIYLQATGFSLNNSVMPVSNRAYSTVEGTLKDIRIDGAGVAIDLSIINTDGKPAESKTFVLDKNCKISRNGSDVSADTLKAGDAVLANISGGICLSLAVKDLRMDLTGILQEIHIASDEQFIVLKTDDGAGKKFYIIPGSIDIYGFRVGMKTRLNVNGSVVETAEILS